MAQQPYGATPMHPGGSGPMAGPPHGGDPRMVSPAPYQAGPVHAGASGPMPMGSPPPSMHGMPGALGQPAGGHPPMGIQPHGHMHRFEPPRSNTRLWVTIGILLLAAAAGVAVGINF